MTDLEWDQYVQKVARIMPEPILLSDTANKPRKPKKGRQLTSLYGIMYHNSQLYDEQRLEITLFVMDYKEREHAKLGR